MQFNDFQLHSKVLEGIEAAGFTTPTPIQGKAIPKALEGHDLIGLAQTGTGKTAAFTIPLMNRLMKIQGRKIRALIVAPTRELAEQIQADLVTLVRHTHLKSITLYGGVGLGPQTQKLEKGAHIVVACPGRLIDHIQRGHLDFSALEMLILDEADQMLDMGFLPDIRKILAHLPARRQTMMFSATMRKEIRQLANDVLTRPVTVQIGSPAPADTVSHTHFPVAQNLKTPLLLKILQETPTRSVLVFTRTKHRARRLSEVLARAGYESTSLQGNLSQNRRQAALNGFKTGKFRILVATDIAARGIDVSKVSHVINYDIPSTAEAYIHRIGRTGRAEHKGMALNLVTNDDRTILRSIDRLLGAMVERRTLPDFDYQPLSRPNAPNRSRKTRSWRQRRNPMG